MLAAPASRRKATGLNSDVGPIDEGEQEEAESSAEKLDRIRRPFRVENKGQLRMSQCEHSQQATGDEMKASPENIGGVQDGGGRCCFGGH